MNILVTGGAGFIGSNFIKLALDRNKDWNIVNLDALTYAGNLKNLSDIDEHVRYKFVYGDIRNIKLLRTLYTEYQFSGVFHFAAESHVDRSIINPEGFLDTNIIGTFRLVDESLKYWKTHGESENFRFLHVSTDEVYGSLSTQGVFTETTPYNPSSPYSASKASSDHIVNAYHRTYGLPTVITNCSNNYGPYQFPEKLIPLMVLNNLEGNTLPVYGDGSNVRDWLYVKDHCEALLEVFSRGRVGESYNIGGGVELSNIEIVKKICDIIDCRFNNNKSSKRLIRFVEDRLGHDQRYAIDSAKIKSSIGWSPKYSFEKALNETIDWFLNNLSWVESVRSGEYQEWIRTNYTNRK